MDNNECVYRLPDGYCTRIKQQCQRLNEDAEYEVYDVKES